MPDARVVERFYERLADHYHLIFENWQAGRHWQADVLLPVLEARS